MKRDQTIEEMYAEARADLASGADVALKWAFKHAKAVARTARAEAAARHFEDDRRRIGYGLPDPSAINGLELVTQSLHAAAVDLADARAAEVAAEHVWQLVARSPRQQAAKPTAVAPKRAA